MIKKYPITKTEAGERLDLFLQKKIVDFSRNQIQEAIKKEKILLNNLPSKSATKLKTGDSVSVDFEYFEELSKPMPLIAEKIPLTVLFEDNFILVIDKPTGMVVHPANGNLSGTLVNALLEYDPKISCSINDNSKLAKMRPGIVHRLDKDTSGVIIVAKNSKSLSSLSKQLSSKKIIKNYTALVFGNTPKSGKIESYLGRDKKNRKKIGILNEANGKLAITKYQKIKKINFAGEEFSLLLIEIPTGRTHQIRVQMKEIGYPVIGDQTYFTKDSKKISDQISIKRQLLHACKIKFHHPQNDKILEIESSLPADFQKVIKLLTS